MTTRPAEHAPECLAVATNYVALHPDVCELCRVLLAEREAGQQPRKLNEHWGYEHLPANPTAEDWTRPDLTDEQLATLPERARTSILHNRFLASAEGERNKGGRPAIGPRIHIALPKSILSGVDAYAATDDRDGKWEKVDRNEAIRRLLDMALGIVIDGKPADVAEWEANGGLSECSADDFDR